MTRRTLLGALVAPLLPTAEDEIPSWVVDPSKITRCVHCDEAPSGAEGTIWCAACLGWYRERYSLEWVRLQPSAGDVITGPNGERVEVTNILECASGTLVYFTRTVPGKGSQERVMWADKWAALEGWDLARLA